MDRNRFSQFEERVQALVEGGFARLFAGRLKPREVALRLARAMEDGAALDAHGSLAAPNRYLVRLHPDDHASLVGAFPDLGPSLVEDIVTLARDGGLRLDTEPEVVLVSDPAVALHTMAVQADHVIVTRQTTRLLLERDLQREEAPSPSLPPAYLVLDGDRYVLLERSVVNIGRRRDNTIVLDDRRVSRHHCQLRYRFGEFVLYDLASRGGTFVNDARVAECVLRSGDVLSLAGVKLVYVVDEGTTGAHDVPGGDTQLYLRPADDASAHDEEW
jgi:hypothetical protein